MFNTLLQLGARYSGLDTTITTTPDVSDGLFAGLFAFIATMWLVWLAVMIVVIIGMWKIFTKAGKPGWHSLIPFLNMYDIMEIAGYNGWYFALVFIPGVGAIIYSILTSLGLAKKFGQSTLFGVLTIFFTPIMYCILGFGSATYNGKPGEGGESVFSGDKPADKPAGDPWVEGK